MKLEKGQTGMLRGQRGIALVAVLWSLVLLSIISTAFLRGARSEAELARNAVGSAKTRALAEAGIHRAALSLGGLSFEGRWRADGRVYPWRFAEGALLISIRDEAGKIDLNAAPPALLRGLFLAAGESHEVASALADAVLDFRDSNKLRRPNGAEDPDYLAAGLARGAKDAPFEVITELRQVLGVSEALYRRLAPEITVHSKLPTVDHLTASGMVLRAIPGTNPGEVEEFLERRAAAGSEAELESLTIPSLAGAADFLSSDDSGLVFGVRAEARAADGAVFVRDAVIALGDGRTRGFSILSWSRGERGAFASADVD